MGDTGFKHAGACVSYDMSIRTSGFLLILRVYWHPKLSLGPMLLIRISREMGFTDLPPFIALTEGIGSAGELVVSLLESQFR